MKTYIHPTIRTRELEIENYMTVPTSRPGEPLYMESSPSEGKGGSDLVRGYRRTWKIGWDSGDE